MTPGVFWFFTGITANGCRLPANYNLFSAIITFEPVADFGRRRRIPRRGNFIRPRPGNRQQRFAGDGCRFRGQPWPRGGRISAKSMQLFADPEGAVDFPVGGQFAGLQYPVAQRQAGIDYESDLLHRLQYFLGGLLV